MASGARIMSHNSVQFICRLRRSTRAKRLRLVVKPGLIEVVAPPGASEAQTLAFLDRHWAWVEKKAGEMAARAAGLPRSMDLADSKTLPWRGREIPLVIREERRRRIDVAIDDEVRICLPNGLGEARNEVVRQALYRWVRGWLQGEVSLLTDRHGSRFGLYPRAIRVKRMKSRWGSCGANNDININWLLAFVPEPVLEYVVVHELCHLHERNHSAAFWSLVAQHLSNYAGQRQWLRAHGAVLMHRFS